MALGFSFTLFAPGALAYAPFLIPMFLACSVPAGLILSWKFAPSLGRWLRSPNLPAAYPPVDHQLSRNAPERRDWNNPFPPIDRPQTAIQSTRRAFAYPLQQRNYADWRA